MTPKYYEIQGGEGSSSEKLEILGGISVKGGGGETEIRKLEGFKASVDTQNWKQKVSKFRNLNQD